MRSIHQYLQHLLAGGFDAQSAAYVASFTGRPMPNLDPATVRARFNRERGHDPNFTLPILFGKLPFSTKSLGDLKPVGIKELMINVKTESSYALLRIVEPVINDYPGFRTVVEDHSGDVCNFILLIHVPFNKSRSPAQELPVGHVFALKAPFVTVLEGERYCLVAATSAECITISRGHQLYDSSSIEIKWKGELVVEEKTPLEWKNMGNEFYRSGKYLEAIEAYTAGLKNCVEEKLLDDLNLNMAAAFFEAGRYELVLKQIYAANVLPDNLKALSRAGRAHYELRQYQEAKQMFVLLRNKEPKSDFANSSLRQVTKRLIEASDRVDMAHLKKMAKDSCGSLIDHAEYTGPVQIVPIEGKGRGIIATTDLKPGTLVAVSKALHCHFGGSDRNDNLFKIFIQTVQNAIRNPKFYGNQLYKLSTNQTSGQGQASYNEFVKDSNDAEPVVDVFRIIRIIQTNIMEAAPKGGPNSSALFDFPSYFNHACMMNTFGQFYNNVRVYRTVTFVRQGDELNISYLGNIMCYHKRHQRLTDFVCKCKLCLLDRAEPKDNLKNREELNQQFIKLFDLDESADSSGYPVEPRPSFRGDSSEALRIVHKMQFTYRKGRKLRPELYLMYITLASHIVHCPSGRVHVQDALDYVYYAIGTLGLTFEKLKSCVENPDKLLTPDAILTYDFLTEVSAMMLLLLYHAQDMDEVGKWDRVSSTIGRVYLGDMTQVPRASDFLRFFQK